ncbi:hypothetical protein K466DRAFT_41616 [Polyporus arcularius HHB13444]|uniref:Uncharacterized protein n=1 Tax=Polyporus arcularius HHB13444 TaxID=1314778 RepID=A0A5C3PLP6_9APHY|nr:hypothetical protein K466DRAFT_41616 [Polyporus arcularius HHB13444]
MRPCSYGMAAAVGKGIICSNWDNDGDNNPPGIASGFVDHRCNEGPRSAMFKCTPTRRCWEDSQEGQAGSTIVVRARGLLPFAVRGATEDREEMYPIRAGAVDGERRRVTGRVEDSMGDPRRGTLCGAAGRSVSCVGLERVAVLQQLPQEDGQLTQPMQGCRDECTEEAWREISVPYWARTIAPDVNMLHRPRRRNKQQRRAFSGRTDEDIIARRRTLR